MNGGAGTRERETELPPPTPPLSPVHMCAVRQASRDDPGLQQQAALVGAAAASVPLPVPQFSGGGDVIDLCSTSDDEQEPNAAAASPRSEEESDLEILGENLPSQPLPRAALPPAAPNAQAQPEDVPEAMGEASQPGVETAFPEPSKGQPTARASMQQMLTAPPALGATAAIMQSGVQSLPAGIAARPAAPQQAKGEAEHAAVPAAEPVYQPESPAAPVHAPPLLQLPSVSSPHWHPAKKQRTTGTRPRAASTLPAYLLDSDEHMPAESGAPSPANASQQQLPSAAPHAATRASADTACIVKLYTRHEGATGRLVLSASDAWILLKARDRPDDFGAMSPCGIAGAGFVAQPMPLCLVKLVLSVSLSNARQLLVFLLDLSQGKKCM